MVTCRWHRPRTHLRPRASPATPRPSEEVLRPPPLESADQGAKRNERWWWAASERWSFLPLSPTPTPTPCPPTIGASRRVLPFPPESGPSCVLGSLTPQTRPQASGPGSGLGAERTVRGRRAGPTLRALSLQLMDTSPFPSHVTH